MAPRNFVDLHCHTRASFDSLSSPASVVRAAMARGLTHLAITDHDRIDGALEAREIAARAVADGSAGLSIIVGEEIRTADGDLIALFLDRVVPPGMSAPDTIAAIREQGGLVGIPHPFDRFRGTLARGGGMGAVVDAVDWIETHNARLVGRGNDRAAELAAERGLAGVAVSDAHTVLEIGVAYAVLQGDPSTAAGLRAALAAGPELVPGRASVVVRVVTPIAKVVQRVRGNGRVARSAGNPGDAAVSGAPRR